MYDINTLFGYVGVKRIPTIFMFRLYELNGNAWKERRVRKGSSAQFHM